MMESEKMEGGSAKRVLPPAGNPGLSPASTERAAFVDPASRQQRPPFSLQPSAFSLLFYYWLPLLAYCLLIFIQSSYPAPEQTPALPFMDKWLHLVGYALFGVLCDRAFRRQWPQVSPRRLFWAAVIATALYGASDEIHQYFVPLRSADPLDAAADALGGLLGVGVFRGLSAWAARRSGAAS